MSEAAETVGTEGTTEELGGEVTAETEPFGTEGESTEELAGGEAAVEASEEPDTYEVVIDGRVERVNHDELLKGYQRQADYTRKTQAVAREREALAGMQALQSALESDPRNTLIALAGALGVNLGGAAAQSSVSAEAGETDPFEVLARQVQTLVDGQTQQQRAAQEAAQRAQQQEMARQAVLRETDELETSVGELDQTAREELWRHAFENNIPTLRGAYESLQYRKHLQEKAAERNAATLAAKRKAQVVSGGQSAAPGAVAKGSGERMSAREAIPRAFLSPQ